jgi:hypothetical protein
MPRDLRLYRDLTPPGERFREDPSTGRAFPWEVGRMRRAILLFVAALLLVSVVGVQASAAPPTRHIYWSNWVDGTIGRANLDGTGVRQDFITGITGSGGPTALAADSKFIYWGTYMTGDGNGWIGSIGRARLDGRQVDSNFITPDSGVQGLAVDSRYIYWGNWFAGTIGRARLNGKQVDQSFITNASSPFGVAVDDQLVYWVNGNNETDSTIGRANLDGTGVDQSFIAGDYLYGVAVDSAHIYWTDYIGYYPPYGPGYIGRANLDGSDVDETLVTTTTGNLGDIVVDDGYLYWANANGTVARANVDGSGLDEDFITGGSVTWDVAVGG